MEPMPVCAEQIDDHRLDIYVKLRGGSTETSASEILYHHRRQARVEPVVKDICSTPRT
jgi:hypothetical protein